MTNRYRNTRGVFENYPRMSIEKDSKGALSANSVSSPTFFWILTRLRANSGQFRTVTYQSTAKKGQYKCRLMWYHSFRLPGCAAISGQWFNIITRFSREWGTNICGSGFTVRTSIPLSSSSKSKPSTLSRERNVSDHKRLFNSPDSISFMVIGLIMTSKDVSSSDVSA